MIAGTAREFKRDHIVKVGRLSGIKNFVGKRDKFIFSTFISQWRDLRLRVI